jgi:hypothetical protein
MQKKKKKKSVYLMLYQATARYQCPNTIKDFFPLVHVKCEQGKFLQEGGLSLLTLKGYWEFFTGSLSSSWQEAQRESM